ncbi:Rmd1p, partial [Ascoidea rubescens DSM 1968]
SISKIGPQRSSRTIQKLKLLPDASTKFLPTKASSADNTRLIKAEIIHPDLNLQDPNAIDDNDDTIYSQTTKTKESIARKDAKKLGKSKRNFLPRVTTYCTSNSIKLFNLYDYLNDHKIKSQFRTSPKLINECLYTHFNLSLSNNKNSNSNLNTNTNTNTNYSSSTFANDENNEIDEYNNNSTNNKYIPSNNANNSIIQNFKLDNQGGDINLSHSTYLKKLFIFEYGVIVFWGYTKKEELFFLNTFLSNFEVEKLPSNNIQIEEFNYYITDSYQPRIYNDFISLNSNKNQLYLTILPISFAISQSVKISLFESLLDLTIQQTQNIPNEIAKNGYLKKKNFMSKNDIMKKIGELFILRININLHGAVLDNPEIMWTKPQLDPIYQATRGYLEINQRVNLLNQRLEVINDLLQMLKEQLSHSHEEYLELIVIALIAVEVLVSLVNIIVDLIAN